jgi:hypothetical protein
VVATLGLLLLATGQLEPGPLDAFRANFASLGASLEFLQRTGLADAGAVLDDALWDRPALTIDEDIAHQVMGRWDCVNGVVHILSSPSDEATKRAKPPLKPSTLSSEPFPYEAVYDQEGLLYHIIGSNNGLQYFPGSVPLQVTHGPFHFIAPYFPYIIDDIFPEVRPVREKGSRGGHPCEIEVYRIDYGGGSWQQLEVAYDPSIGHLPRHVRLVGSAAEGGKKFVREMMLTEARMSAAGGYVPTDWYELNYDVRSVQGRWPQAGARLEPADHRVGVIHFAATKFEDRSAPVRLERLQGVTTLAGPGGVVRLPSDRDRISPERARSVLGRRATTVANAGLPSIDEAELRQFDRRQGWGRWGWSVAVAAPIVVVAAAWWFRRRRAGTGPGLILMTLILPPLVGGCGIHAPPIVRLAAEFERSPLIHDANAPHVDALLIVRNVGNQGLTIFNVDGGCTCRKVDTAALPKRLEPDRSFRVGMRLQNHRSHEKQQFNLNFETSSGRLSVPAELHTLPDHVLDPSTVSLHPIEGEETEPFTLVHRQVHARGEPDVVAVLKTSGPFSIVPTDRMGGRVAGAPGLVYVDQTYRVQLTDSSLGLHKDELVLSDPLGRRLAAATVGWDRSKYVDASPGRVVLGRRPVRVFLRCPDPSVELIAVTRAPVGVKAIVSSPRELIVMLDKDPPNQIGGLIEVETTAAAHPSLTVPVLRYVTDQPAP